MTIVYILIAYGQYYPSSDNIVFMSLDEEKVKKFYKDNYQKLHKWYDYVEIIEKELG